MRFGKLHLTYFGSYAELSLDLDKAGLTLIEGPTGSGKSTIMDSVTWILYGQTSKDSAADDMRSWFSETSTSGTLEVLDMSIVVTRVRGTQSQNDLYYTYTNALDTPIRGKDLRDTQRLLDDVLGINFDLFILGSYLHQFSQAESFFISKAKDRRDIFEKTADLTLPKKLAERSSEQRKESKKVLEEVNLDLSTLLGKEEATIANHNKITANFDAWDTKQKTNLSILEAKAINFTNEKEQEVHKIVDEVIVLSKLVIDPSELINRKDQLKIQINALDNVKKEYKTQSTYLSELNSKYNPLSQELTKLSKLSNTCPTCLSSIDNNNHLSHRIQEVSNLCKDLAGSRLKQEQIVKDLENAMSIEDSIHKSYDTLRDDEVKNNNYIKELENKKANLNVLRSSNNFYEEQFKQEKLTVNPFADQLTSSITLLENIQLDKQSKQKEVDDLNNLVTSLTWLYNKSFELRAYMLEQAKQDINHKTNELLERYFEADLRIDLAFVDQDKLDVNITKSGYPVPYKQLSGGQRDMLRLCFWLAVSKRVESISQTKFSTLMIDEALKGLDSSIKTKVFNLLKSLELEYETILVTDHTSEFQELFDNKVSVRLNGDISELTYE